MLSLDVQQCVCRLTISTEHMSNFLLCSGDEHYSSDSFFTFVKGIVCSLLTRMQPPILRGKAGNGAKDKF